MADTPDLEKLMRMAQKMQEEMKEAHTVLTAAEYTGEAGGGLVKVIMDGRHDIKQIIIDPKVREESLEFLADLIAAATNGANRKVEKATEQKMMSLSQKLGVPNSEDQSD
jgi:nucleoid-associated protein EbfC